jgi:hypothetical protein
MKEWFSRFFSGSKCAPSARRRCCRPELETLEQRELPSATSWFDSYHHALVSAPGQERRLDQIAFAVGSDHNLVETLAGFAFHPGTYAGAVDHGFASDISAGRDFHGYAQCLVHGNGDNLSLYNAHTGRWQDLHFHDKTGADVWQISAGESGTIFVLDTRHCVWGESGGHWSNLRGGVLEIQASRGFFDQGLFIRDVDRNVWHSTFSYISHGHHFYGWEELRLPCTHAHALSVNANNTVFTIDDDQHVLEWHWKDTLGHGLKGYWEQLGDLQARAIDAVTDAAHRDMVYAREIDAQPGDCTPGVDNCGGLARGWSAYQAGSGWQDTGVYQEDFSAASGIGYMPHFDVETHKAFAATTVYVGTLDVFGGKSIDRIDWATSIDSITHLASINWAAPVSNDLCPGFGGVL